MSVDVLPYWERCTYWVVGLSSIAYAIYSLFVEGDEFTRSMTHAAFYPGWSWIGREQDGSDMEWWVWYRIMPQLLVLFTVHVLISRMCFFFNISEEVHTHLQLIFDVIAAGSIVGARVVVLQFCLALAMYGVSFLGSVALVWMTAIVMISSLNVEFIYKYQLQVLQVTSFDHESLFVPIIAFFYLRLISFAVDKVKYHTCKATWTKDSVDTLDSDPSLLDLLFFAFYLPIFPDGPIIVYNDFHSQVKKSFRASAFSVDVIDVVKNLIRIAFWVLFIQFQFHFLYFSSLSSFSAVVDRLSVPAVAGMCYYQGQFFMVKYLVLYGLGSQIARFDGLSPPAGPRCISWVYSYSDMWKYFDCGLYKFIKMYIYVPWGGSRAGFMRQMFASGLAFGFIFVWHGTMKNMLIWCAGNFILGSVEAGAIILNQSIVGSKFKSYLSPAMQLRIKAILICPLYLTCCVVSGFFFFGVDVGWSVAAKLITKASWSSIVIEYTLITSCIHNALYIHQRYKNKNLENKINN